MQDALTIRCTRNEPVGSVGTVVVVGVKSRRRQRVGRLQLRWVRRTRRRGMVKVRAILQDAGQATYIMVCSSTHNSHAAPAAAIDGVHAHSLAHPVRIKTNPVRPVVNHAPVVLSVTRVPPVVKIVQQASPVTLLCHVKIAKQANSATLAHCVKIVKQANSATLVHHRAKLV